MNSVSVWFYFVTVFIFFTSSIFLNDGNWKNIFKCYNFLASALKCYKCRTRNCTTGSCNTSSFCYQSKAISQSDNFVMFFLMVNFIFFTQQNVNRMSRKDALKIFQLIVYQNTPSTPAKRFPTQASLKLIFVLAMVETSATQQ